MNNEDNIIEARGLNRNSNDILLPPGSLIAADEAVIVKDNVISRRRGFKLCNSGLPANTPQQLFVSGGILYVHVNNQLYAKDSNCNYQVLSGAGPLVAPSFVFVNPSDIYFTQLPYNNVKKIEILTGFLSNYAGSVSGTSGSADAGGTAARFNGPFGIYGNSTNLFVGDGYNSTVRQINISTSAVTTLAGTAGASGLVDGVGAAARFSEPWGIWCNATDVYVCDSLNNNIRKINIATANVTTFAGSATGVAGAADGVGTAAKFQLPLGIWGNATDLYVSDTGNDTIRKINLATAIVTTLAGTAGATGSADGIGAAARFDYPLGIWGNATDLYVCDSNNYTIRKINIATASVSTVAGTVGVQGSTDGIGTSSSFADLQGIGGDSTYLYVCDSPSTNSLLRRITISTSEVITFAGTVGKPAPGDTGYLFKSLVGPT